MPALPPEQIVAGTPVRHCHQQDRVGILTGRTMGSGNATMVQVRWGTQTVYEPAAGLELLDVNEDTSFQSLVANGRYDRIESLRSLMTFEKLSGGLSNVMYSMKTAEIQFFAHQFVPVLRFINSPLSRLLIADEVGLGKTIEAGLIWTECRARFQARRLLVICPPTLVPKWIRELSDRFSVDARYADAAELYRQIKLVHQRGATHSFALVSSYQALRPRRKEKELLRPWLSETNTEVSISSDEPIENWKTRPALFRTLLEWEANPAFDLVVFDEAHLMKNTATANHLVGDVFSTSTQALLALSATPLTTNTRDLFALLKLVDPDMFRDEQTYNGLIRRNRYAVRLASQLDTVNPDRERCIEFLAQLPDSMARNNLAREIRAVPDLGALSTEERVGLKLRVGRLNELGAFLSRTRKVEINQHKAQRNAVTLEVTPTTEELALYNAVLAQIRRKVRERGDELSLFHLIAPALSMTSCLPVMARKLRDGESRWGDMEDLTTLGDAFTEGADTNTDFVGEDAEAMSLGLSALPNYDFEANDTKFDRLRRELLSHKPSEKVIVFAFFKETLRYLKQRLEREGIGCLLVTGDVTDRDERDKLLCSFKESDYRILLCSEVASEGVDLQFCRVMVNYDLPWNPMRVEQRIGRIDRIGQEADSIVIINFHVAGTIDGSIYEHLYKNIGVFHETIGDLEGILGEKVNQLTKELLSNTLTTAQVEERVRTVANAVARERAILSEIDEQSDTLLGLRPFLQNKVEEGRSLGRFIKPSELRLFVDQFFSDTYSGTDFCHLNWDTPAQDCLRLTLSFRAMADFQDFLERKSYPFPAGVNPASRMVTLTFTPEKHTDLRLTHRSLILVNHLHPLIQWMSESLRGREKSWHPVSALRLSTADYPPGNYFFGVMRVTIHHPKLSRDELLFRVVSLETLRDMSLQDSESLINQAIEKGSSWTSVSGFPDTSDAFGDVFGQLAKDCESTRAMFFEDLELRLNSTRAQVKNHFERKIEIAERRLEGMLANIQIREQGVRLTQSQIEHLKRRLDEELGQLDGGDEVSPKYTEIACGLIQVVSPAEGKR